MRICHDIVTKRKRDEKEMQKEKDRKRVVGRDL